MHFVDVGDYCSGYVSTFCVGLTSGAIANGDWKRGAAVGAIASGILGAVLGALAVSVAVAIAGGIGAVLGGVGAPTRAPATSDELATGAIVAAVPYAIIGWLGGVVGGWFRRKLEGKGRSNGGVEADDNDLHLRQFLNRLESSKRRSEM